MSTSLIRLRLLRALLVAIAALSTGLFTGLSPAAAQDAEPPVEIPEPPIQGPDNPPLAYGGEVTPTSLDFNGGQVTIKASGLDDYGIFMFYANVTGPDVFVEDVAMWPSHIPDNPNEPIEYTGVFNVPANVHDYPVTYYFNSTVTDQNGGFANAYIGSVEVGPIQEIDEPPYLWEPTLSSKTLPSGGGSLTLGVKTFDDTGVASAVAKITGPNGFAKDVDLSPVDQTVYQGSTVIPANTGTAPVQYSVTFTGYDDISQTTTIDGGTFTVAAPTAPPLGLLSVSPANQFFGPVAAGRSVRRNVVVRNTGKPGSGTLVANATVSGPPYSIIGAGPFGQPIELAPGESKILVVEFKPRRGGLFSGRVTVTRPDGRQRAQVATLTGLALP